MFEEFCFIPVCEDGLEAREGDSCDHRPGEKQWYPGPSPTSGDENERAGVDWS